MAGLRFSPAAQADLEAIYDYTARQWGAEQAGLYMELLESACLGLAADPALGQDCGDIRPGYRRGAAGRHHVYFRFETYGIAVIRILHQRMDALRHL